MLACGKKDKLGTTVIAKLSKVLKMFA